MNYFLSICPSITRLSKSLIYDTPTLYGRDTHRTSFRSFSHVTLICELPLTVAWCLFTGRLRWLMSGRDTWRGDRGLHWVVRRFLWPAKFIWRQVLETFRHPTGKRSGTPGPVSLPIKYSMPTKCLDHSVNPLRKTQRSLFLPCARIDTWPSNSTTILALYWGIQAQISFYAVIAKSANDCYHTFSLAFLLRRSSATLRWPRNLLWNGKWSMCRRYRRFHGPKWTSHAVKCHPNSPPTPKNGHATPPIREWLSVTWNIPRPSKPLRTVTIDAGRCRLTTRGFLDRRGGGLRCSLNDRFDERGAQKSHKRTLCGTPQIWTWFSSWTNISFCVFGSVWETI